MPARRAGTCVEVTSANADTLSIAQKTAETNRIGILPMASMIAPLLRVRHWDGAAQLAVTYETAGTASLR